MLRGIIPILITPFDDAGRIDEDGLRAVVRFELDGGIDGIGVGGFASEAYKLTDAERLRCAQIVAEEVAGRVPFLVGLAAGSTEAAVEAAQLLASLNPAALMTLPPNTMQYDEAMLVDYYVRLAAATSIPVMVQQSPQVAAYSHCQLPTDALAQIARYAPSVRYFKIEGPGSARRIRALRERAGEGAVLFGGVGGITIREELESGASGLLPGVGFNEFFRDAWSAWQVNDAERVDNILRQAAPLVEAVSGHGHEFSLHARKRLFHDAGLIASPYVRRPTVFPDESSLYQVIHLVATLDLRIARR
jgi:4-hydroxy-tetrahydrodipicolinate synthase